jgi:hypothetical protein
MSRMKTPVTALSVLVALACAPLPTLASPILGPDLLDFAVLGASTVTNVPTSGITGDVGVWAGTAVTGINHISGTTATDPQVSGLVHSATTKAADAQAQLAQAKIDLTSMGPGTLLGNGMTNLTLAPGVYSVGAALINGTLTLDGGGNANAAWVFNIASTLVNATYSVVEMVDAGPGAGVFWNVGSSATISVGSTFLGNVLAYASVTANTSATNACGRFLADTAAVTLQMNTISTTCSGDLAGSNGLSGGIEVTESGGTRTVSFVAASVAPVPLPGALGLLGLGVLGLVAVRRKRTAV